MNLSRRAVFAAGLAAAASPAFSAPARSAPLSAEDQALVRSATAYLQGLSTATGRFTQTDAHGEVTHGTFYLQRPGMARFDYDPPSGLVIASDGHEVSIVDRRLRTIQSYPLAMTPLSLLLARDIRLDRNVTVTRVLRGPGGFTLFARDARRKAGGQLALTFREAPLALAGWALTDAQGATVRVDLSDLAPAAPRERTFFEIYRPEFRSGAPN